MAQVILNLEFDEFLRTFTAEAKKERFCLLLQGLNAMPGESIGLQSNAL